VSKSGRGDVWCPTTKLGSWVARQPDGQIFVTGNSVSAGIFAGHTWEAQLNCYGFLRRPLGDAGKKLEGWALLRDWEKSKARYGNDPKYPPIPFVRVQIPLWSMKKAEEYVYERLAMFEGDPLPCTPEEKWQTPTVYKVMKKGRKSALIATRYVKGEKQDLLSVAEALEAAKGKGYNVDGTQVYIQKFKGENKRCQDYCIPHIFCKDYQENNNVQ